MRVATLESQPAGTANQQRVAGERGAAVVEHQRQAAVGVAGRRADVEVAMAESDPVAVVEPQVRTLDRRLVAPRDADRQPVAACISQAPVT